MKFADPWRVNADLHSHSYESDGVLRPSDLADRAAANGVELWALTDHDELAGLQEAADQARARGMRFVAGVEISVTWGSDTIHILGLNIDPHNTDLEAGLASTRDGRLERAREMAAGLTAVGIDGAFEGALAYVQNPSLISRTHFARFLVDSGRCSDMSEVFHRYLGEGKPGFVPHRWARLRDAVSWIRQAQGVPVVAHPARYKFSDTESWAFFSEFAEAGGQAIEVVSSSHTRDEVQRFARLARDFGFSGSRGSDFHSPEEGHIELGRVPPLPDSVVPVWADWA